MSNTTQKLFKFGIVLLLFLVVGIIPSMAEVEQSSSLRLGTSEAIQSFDAPVSFDWRTLGGVTPIKDQGGCGADWAFASVGVAESLLKIFGGVETDLSEQYLIGHNENGWGCAGGGTAFDYFIFRVPGGEREPGAVLESECPYVAMEERCPGPQPLRHPHIFDGWDALLNSREAIKEAIFQYGPVKTSVCAGPEFVNYTSGVFEIDEAGLCVEGGPRRTVTLVGWDDNLGTEGAWILRNSWGSDWGDGGYMYIGYGISSIGENSSYLIYDGTYLESRDQIGGLVRSVALQYPYAYTNVGPRVVVMDISDPADPRLVGSSQPLSSIVKSVYISGTHLYVAESVAGLKIFDVSDPTQIELVGESWVNHMQDVVVSASQAYICDGANVHIYDVSDSSNPMSLAMVDTPGSARSLAVAGNYAYVADLEAGLTVLDITNPISPTVVTSYDTPGKSFGVAVDGDYVYVADGTSGLRIIDVSVPSAPNEVGFIDTPGDALWVEVSANHAFVAELSGGLRIIDVTNPESPVKRGYFNTHGRSHRVAIHGSHAYLADSTTGLWVINIANPVEPYETGVYETVGQGYKTMIAESYAYVASGWQGVRVVDVTSSDLLVDVGAYQSNIYMTGLDLSGPYLYAVDMISMKVLDLANPIHPVKVGSINLNQPRDVDIDEGYAYVASHTYGLRIVDVANPASPIAIASIDTPGNADRIFKTGDYAYVADAPENPEGGGLYIFDVSDPYLPNQTAFFDTPGDIVDVQVVDNYAYVIDRDLISGTEVIPGGLYILDISNPSSPTQLNYIPVNNPRSLWVADEIAYIGGTEIKAFDVSDPYNPELMGSVNLYDTIRSITVSDNYLWAGAYSLGLYRIQLEKDRLTGYIPPTGGDIQSKGDVVSLTFPDGTFGEEAAIAFRHLWIDPQEIGYSGVERTFSLDAVAHTSSQPVSPSLPYTMEITYTPGQIDENTLGLYAYDGIEWTREASSVVDTVLHRVSANPDHMGLFSILGCIPPESAPIQGPITVTVGNEVAFTASVEPITATLPLTFTWRTDEQAEQVFLETSPTSEITYTWNTPGMKTIDLAVHNCGVPVIAVHQVDVVAPPIPDTPSGLIATEISQSEIELTWTDNSDNESGFKVERSMDGVSGWTEIAEVSSNVTTFSDSGLDCGTTYYYRVRAYNEGGSSGYSNVVHVKILSEIYLPLITR